MRYDDATFEIKVAIEDAKGETEDETTEVQILSLMNIPEAFKPPKD